VDTADGYTKGRSEEIIGDFFSKSPNRDRVVLATKYTFGAVQGDPNAGGNGRKNLYRALEGSLRQLKTDYIDLYWVHCWDGVTPVEEVMSTLDAVVRSGKVRAIGLSDTPAWYLTRAQTLAEWRGWERVAALQLEYSLTERNIEREHIPAALELGMGLCPWSPLASGFLSGRYQRTQAGGEGEGRLKVNKNVNRFTEHNWKVLEVLTGVAKELGRSPAQVAVNWVTKRRGVSSTIIGATSLEQLDDNLKALEFDIPAPLAAKLEEVGRPDLLFPYTFFNPDRRGMLTGATQVQRYPPWYWGH
jgi:aryl-alcohol dehydrogenase-like predicted oxidoreductase